MSNEKVYIHEFIDIIGHNRARYMHHMTANWCPIAREERNQLCFGVWGTVGSTGRWPEVVNVWELDGWDGLVANFEHEFSTDSLQDPSLAEWWAEAAEFRRGGVDRILVPEPWTRSIDELTAAGVRGEVYAHDVVTTPPGRAGAFLDAVGEQAERWSAAGDVELVGAWKVAMVNDSECILLLAFPDWASWARLEEARTGGASFTPLRAAATRLGATWRRTLLVDAPLAPLRTGRQPQVEDRVSLNDL